MSPDPITDTRKKLDELEQRILAAKSSLGARGEISDRAAKDWQAMVEAHADIRRKLDARPDHPNGVLEGIHFDIDILRHSFEKWVANVEDSFDK